MNPISLCLVTRYNLKESVSDAKLHPEPGNRSEFQDEESRSLFNALPFGVLVFDREGNLLFANNTALSAMPIQGCLPQARPISPVAARAQLRELFRLVDPDTERDVPIEQSPLSRALLGQSTQAQEFMLRSQNSSRRAWVEISAQPILDAAGKVNRVVFTFRGIGDRKKRELEAESAQRLHSIIYQENLAGILRVTVDGRILDCNGAIVRMLGYPSKRSLLNVRAPQFYYDPADRERILRLLNATRRLSEFEVCFRRLDGSRCWVILSARLLDPPPGEIGGSIVSTLIDISERKQHEEILRKSEQRFAAFMRHMPGVAFIKDLTGKYVYYNEASWTNFRRRPEEIIGLTDAELWPENEAAHFRQNDLNVIEGQRPLEFVERIVQEDGTHTWLMYKFPITEQDQVSWVGGVGIDITERTVLEEQLTQAGKMEALGRLAGGVAHDFNNLLTVMAGYGQLALESVGSAPPERMKTYLREILDSSRRASGLTGQLLAFSRRQALQLKVVDLGVLLRDMERLLHRVIGEHVELIVQPGGGDCLIQADANQMEQAIMNLAVNARDAMPLGGQLTLRCERLAQPLRQDPIPGLQIAESLEVLLEVRDTGIGMESAVQAQIFDPFFTSKEHGKGTGLGLSTVYGVVSQAKGKIELESAPGEGTVFRLYFPAAAPESEEIAPIRRSAASPAGRETVLLVEDEASVRALAETILKRLGYTVLVADSGPAAIRLWEQRSGRVDLLLTDVIMPQMSGGDLAHRLRENNPHLRVLFMSGYTDDMIASHGVLAGETQLIQKPFTADALGRKIRGVLDA
jgi:two-component system, cell cycle sensor histidine kinase and response regulator CckA